GDVPIVKLTLEHKQYETIAAGKIERDVSAIFDNQIEQELNKSGIENKLDKLVTTQDKKSTSNKPNEESNTHHTIDSSSSKEVVSISTFTGKLYQKTSEPESLEAAEETNKNLRHEKSTEKEI
ncbi:MAG TPA: hypothetical protein ACHBZ9_12535, partial [Arsenophonus nasoniae]|uniref:hypothetical protein n=1 Tax=Arsenophonus nasoniae TaxID=638 RepID=UPI003879E820